MKTLIVANGNFLPRELILEISQNCTIVALDGAAERLMQRGITPQIILGDFDSLKNKRFLGVKDATEDGLEEPYQGEHGVTIVPRRKDQDRTDLQKAIRYVKQQGASEIHVVCAFSESRLDHAIFNPRILRAEYSNDCEIFIHGLGQSLKFVSNATLNMKGDPQDHCGILAFPTAQFSSTGLAWNRGGSSTPFVDSPCNVVVSEIAQIRVQGEALVVLPPQFKKQREFSALDEEKLLEILYKEASYAS